MAVVWTITPLTITPRGSGGISTTIARYTVTGGTIPKTGGSFAFYNAPDWLKKMTITRSTDTTGYISAVVSANVSNIGRGVTITFEYEPDEGGAITSDAQFNQESPEDNPSYGFLSYPWNINIPKGCTYSISITAGNDIYREEVYRGKPFIDSRYTSEAIELNSIAKQFVSTAINDTNNFSFDEPEYTYTNFVWCDVKIWNEGNGESESYPRSRSIIIFNNDWSYDHSRNYFYTTAARTYTAGDSRTGLIVLNDPINGHGSPLQRFTFNVWSESSDENDKYILESNGTELASIHPHIPDNFSHNVKITVDPGEVTNDISIRKSNATESIRYDTSYCGDFVLYYLNSYGGYDSFLIENNVRESHSITQTKSGIQSKIPTFSLSDRKTTVSNSITTNWDFNSGWLTDAESDRFYRHLLSSPEVYLVDLKADRWYVVTITNLSHERKCFRNGRKLVSYDVSLEGSILTERR